MFKKSLMLFGFVCGLLVFSSDCFGKGGTIDLAKGDYVIVISKDATAIADFAAQELQFYLKKITGKTLPIEDDGRVDNHKNLILVGPSTYTKKNKNQKFDAGRLYYKDKWEKPYSFRQR